jgi:hypothetical protein
LYVKLDPFVVDGLEAAAAGDWVGVGVGKEVEAGDGEEEGTEGDCETVMLSPPPPKVTELDSSSLVT